MTNTLTSVDLYAAVQHFYARQMQLIDSGHFEAYADTFTEDGVFQHTPGRAPAVTRPGIVRDLLEFNERFAGAPVKRRHWFDMIALDLQDDGTIVSTYYALVVTVRPGVKQPEIGPSCTVHDVLVLEDGQLRNKSRHVEHDQLF
jgi:actinorhodin biosynthesis protein ActVIA